MRYSVLVVSPVITSILVLTVLLLGIGGMNKVTDWSANPYSDPYYSSYSIYTTGLNYFFHYAESIVATAE